MCGIFAYTGKEKAAPILLDGLTALEYRGYDSAGVYVDGAGAVKSTGAVHNLRAKIDLSMVDGTSGIAHTRWATHGEPTETNAHPHADCKKEVWLVHNGIIENYIELREHLSARGHTFASETDSEILAHLIEEYEKEEKDFSASVFRALRKIRGTYGVAVLHTKDPDTIIVARMGSPIVLGIGEGEYFVASDTAPLIRHTRSVLYLNDGEVAILNPSGYRISTLSLANVTRDPEKIEWDVSSAEKGGYEHFMLKEIMEGPEVILNALRGRVILDEGNVQLGGLREVHDRLRKTKRIIITGCGTAYYAALVGEYVIEECAGIPVEVEIASEFRYRKPIIDEHTTLIAVSQSGETIDTLSALREAKRKGALTIGIVNVVGSTIARETDAGIYNHAGPEISVASTKAMISQISVLVLLAVYLGRQRALSVSEGKEILEDLISIPEKIEHILLGRERIQEVAEQYVSAKDFLYIGRTYQYPIALEGALKLKELAYVHAEGYSAGEMKHGPIAMIDEQFPTIAIALHGPLYEKMISNMQEIRARKGKIIALVTEGDTQSTNIADAILYIPSMREILSPILSVVPLHLFAYYLARAKGNNVDRPRNLAKSVTVE